MTGRVRRWPLFLIAAPAAVAVWSGWVGLGALCGFGIIHPLPGIVSAFRINTAITLPVGVEAYGAYALGAWLTPGTPDSARRFARWSALGALTLGMAGQVVYHLLAAVHAARAPWPVVVFVSCLPVVALGCGAALAHLLRADDELKSSSDQDHAPAEPRTDPLPAPRTEVAAVRAARLTAEAVALRELAPDPAPDPDRIPARRDVVVAELAAEILAAAAAGDTWRPDYPALMARTGRRRSWAEKAVRDARRTALGAAPVRVPAHTEVAA